MTTEANVVLYVPHVVHCVVTRKSKKRKQPDGTTDKYDVWIGTKKRNHVQSAWCNPFTEADDKLVRFQAYLTAWPDLLPKLEQLSGKILQCNCDEKECHGSLIVAEFQKAWPKAIVMTTEQVQARQTAIKTEQLKVMKLKDECGSLEAATSSTKKRKKTTKRPPKPKKPKAPRPVRSVLTHPDGLTDKGELWPWPKVDNIVFDTTVYADESSRGCWAGPMAVSAVVLHKGFDIVGLHDSKLLTESERKTAYEALMASEHVTKIIHQVSVEDIDRGGIGRAWKVAMAQLINEMRDKVKHEKGITITHALIDGDTSVNVSGVTVYDEVQADRKHIGVAAAAILAKYSRDELIVNCGNMPIYKPFQHVFVHNKAYGTGTLQRNILIAGVYTDLHRRSFNPLKTLVQDEEWVRNSIYLCPPVANGKEEDSVKVLVAAAEERLRSATSGAVPPPLEDPQDLQKVAAC